MNALLDCVSCSGFMPHGAQSCPHCGHAVARASNTSSIAKGGLFGTIATAAAGGLMSLTLMACYGIPYIECENLVDADGDGFSTSPQENCEVPGGRDCNDKDPNTNPDAEDSKGDGIDQNCDGEDGIADGTGGGGHGGNGGNGGGGNGGGGNGGSGGSTSTVGD